MTDKQHKQFLEEIRLHVVETIHEISLENTTTNKELKEQVQEISETLKPIAEVYANLNGGWKVLKWVIVTASLVMGLLISIKVYFSK